MKFQKIVDLENEKQVKIYLINFGILYIELVNGKIIEIEGDVNDIDYKRPESMEIYSEDEK